MKSKIRDEKYIGSVNKVSYRTGFRKATSRNIITNGYQVAILGVNQLEYEKMHLWETYSHGYVLTVNYLITSPYNSQEVAGLKGPSYSVVYKFTKGLDEKILLETGFDQKTYFYTPTDLPGKIKRITSPLMSIGSNTRYWNTNQNMKLSYSQLGKDKTRILYKEIKIGLEVSKVIHITKGSTMGLSLFVEKSQTDYNTYQDQALTYGFGIKFHF